MTKLTTKLAVASITLVGSINLPVSAVSEPGLFVAIDAGRSQAHKYCDGLTSCDDSDRSLRTSLGYQFNTTWSGEVGYTSFGTLFDSSDNSVNASQKANAWTLSSVASLPIGEKFGFYGRAGAARYSTDNSGTVQGVPVKDRHDIKPFFGIGMDLDFTSNFSLRSEYQYYADISGVDGSSDDVQGLYVGTVFRF